MQTAENQLLEPAGSSVRDNGWLPYVLPFALFVLFSTVIEPQLRDHYVWVYLVKVGTITGALVSCRAPWGEIRFDRRMLVLGTLAGLFLCALWVLGEKFIPYPHPSFLGSRPSFNPFKEIADPLQRGLFLAARFFGLTVLVAVSEELFWRGFVLRYLTRPEFQQVALDRFTWPAAVIMAVLFGFSHPEWLSAILFALAMAWILKRTRSLFACIVAHGVTNLALGIFVLTTGNWRLW